MLSLWPEQPPGSMALVGDMVDPVSYAPCSKRPESHVVIAAIGPVTTTSDLTDKCGLSNRPAQFFCLGSCTAELKTMVNPSALGGQL